MDKKPKAEVIAEFWERMEATIGFVPVNVKLLVNVLELAATSWLGDITAADVSGLEALVCWNGNELWTQACKDGYYEEGCLDMGEDFRSFELSIVEKKCLVAVAGAVKRYGHHYFTDERRPKYNLSVAKTEACLNQDYEFSEDKAIDFK